MTWDEFTYALMLLIALVLGPYHSKIKDKELKIALGSIVGLSMVFIICGTFIYHSLVTVVINGIIIFTFPRRHRAKASFAWCFGYISFFRTTHWFGLEKVPPLSNAVQLLITLKLVGIAFEMNDTEDLREAVKKEESEEKKLQLEYMGVSPSPIEYFHYAYCYIGLLTGPYFKFRTLRDMVDQSGYVPIQGPLYNRLWRAPIYGLLYLLVSHFYFIEYATTEEFFARAFPYRFFYMAIMFVVFRLRMYFAWIMSECVCMAARLGAYPEASKPRCGAGPTDLKALDAVIKAEKKEGEVTYNFETIHNIDEWGCEFNTTVREGMKSWNMTVQFWLAYFVYKRVPMRSTRTVWTMIVSSYWHGVKPGYFLSFLTVPLSLQAESALQRFLPPGPVYQWTAWFFKMRCFDYMAMSFLLLEFWSTVNYWASIYFIVHIAIAALIGAGMVVRPRREK